MSLAGFHVLDFVGARGVTSHQSVTMIDEKPARGNMPQCNDEEGGKQSVVEDRLQQCAAHHRDNQKDYVAFFH